jgi:hypothetical protein
LAFPQPGAIYLADVFENFDSFADVSERVPPRTTDDYLRERETKR